MKFSIYNNFIPYENNIIGHNGLSNEYIVIETYLYDIISNNSNDSDKTLQLLENKYPDFYAFLITKNFIVDENINELDKCIEQLNNQDNDVSHYELHINPTMNCNFKCWYCYESHIKDSKINPDTKNNIVKFVNNLLAEKQLKSFQLNWFGGEPLLYFDKVMIPLLTTIKRLCDAKAIRFFSLITSNGLLINDKVIEKCKENNVRYFQITLDGHRERHNKVRFISESRGSYDQIVGNIKKLVSNEIRVNVRINCSKETFQGLKKIADDFSDVKEKYGNYLDLDFHKIWQVEEGLGDEINIFTDYFRNKGFKVFSLNANVAKYSCYADKKNHATINYNGEVFKCTARDFTTANSEGKLTDDGAIIWNEKYERRFDLKYTNKPCLKCSIFPVCGGGCSQQSLENAGKDYCVYHYDENKKMKLILDKFLSMIQ